MATPQNLESAKIIQFPLHRRLGGYANANDKALNEAERPHVTYDSWYHDEAVNEERSRKQ